MASVSIVIAAHNEGDNVRRTLRSVAQFIGDADIELILIDDGSSDGSFAFLDEDPFRRQGWIRPIRLGSSVGCIQARHCGASAARHDHLLFLDAHMAVTPGWLGALTAAHGRWGPLAAITPDVVPLDVPAWLPGQSSGLTLGINETLDFVWTRRRHPAGLVPIVGGACVFMSRRLYEGVGGFDLGLRRWGGPFIDLSLKVYAAGGACYCAREVVVGHLFRRKFPYAVAWRDVIYNRLRIGFIHFSDRCFDHLVQGLRNRPAFAAAMEDIEADKHDLMALRARQRAAGRRDPDWFARAFIPTLLTPRDLDRCPRCRSRVDQAWRFCSHCGSALDHASQPERIGLALTESHA